MKLHIFGLLFLTAISAHSATVETVVTCEQTDGDQWVSVGIGLSDGPGFITYVVRHNDDTGSRKLVSQKAVILKRSSTLSEPTFEDREHTFRLSTRKRGSRLTGMLSSIEDGPGSIKISNMDCFLKSEISF